MAASVRELGSHLVGENNLHAQTEQHILRTHIHTLGTSHGIYVCTHTYTCMDQQARRGSKLCSEKVMVQALLNSIGVFWTGFFFLEDCQRVVKTSYIKVFVYRRKSEKNSNAMRSLVPTYFLAHCVHVCLCVYVFV